MKNKLSERLRPAPRMCTHHKVQYEIFTSSAPDTGFIFVEAKSPRGPASVKVSTQQNTGRPVGSGLETEECDRD